MRLFRCPLPLLERPALHLRGRQHAAPEVNGINQLALPGSPFGKGMGGIFKDLSAQDLWVMIQPQATVKFSHSAVESH